jgi:hypothetical protein
LSPEVTGVGVNRIAIYIDIAIDINIDINIVISTAY